MFTAWIRSLSVISGAVEVPEPHTVVEASRCDDLIAQRHGGVHIHAAYQHRVAVSDAHCGGVRVAPVPAPLASRRLVVVWHSVVALPCRVVVAAAPSRDMGAVQMYLQRDVVERLSQPRSAKASGHGGGRQRSNSFSTNQDEDQDRFFDNKGADGAGRVLDMSTYLSALEGRRPGAANVRPGSVAVVY